MLLQEALVGRVLSGCGSFVQQLGVVKGVWGGMPCVRGIVLEFMAGGDLSNALQ